MTPESTEPRAAARESVQDVIARAILEFDAPDVESNVESHALSIRVQESLAVSGYTIAPTEPGRVVIEVEDLSELVEEIEATDYAGYFDEHPLMMRIQAILTAAERPADDEWPVSMASIRQAIRWTGCVDIAKYPWDEEDERAAAEFLSALAAAERPDEMVVIRRADAELLSQPNPEQDGIYTAMAKDRVHQALAASSAEPDAACGQGEETE